MTALAASRRAAQRTARIASVADGTIVTEVRAEGAVTALEFAQSAATIAVGDATGRVVLAPLADDAVERVLELGAGTTALAFAPDGARLAVGDVGGAIALVGVPGGEVQGEARHWRQPIRWLEWSPDGGALLAATDSWLHALSPSGALMPVQSKLVVWPAASTALAAVSSTVVGFAGVDIGGALESGEIDLTAAPSSSPSDAAALVARDWPAAFALRLNDNGDLVPFDP